MKRAEIRAIAAVVGVMASTPASGAETGAAVVPVQERTAEGFVDADGAVYADQSRTELSKCPPNTSSHYAVREGVLKIVGPSAFEECGGLKSLHLPASVAEIMPTKLDQFRYCEELAEIKVAEDNPYLSSEDGVLFDKAGTTLIRCPTGKDGSYNIPKNVTRIAPDAFAGCNRLTSISIPEGVSAIGDRAFEECTGVESIVIPNSVTYIGREAFEDCSKIKNITIPGSVRGIDRSAFADCVSLRSATLEKGVENIGWEAFAGCDNLTSVSLPDGIRSIGTATFAGCTRLKSLRIPETVEDIGNQAFSGCDALAELNIPARFLGELERLGFTEEQAARVRNGASANR